MNKSPIKQEKVGAKDFEAAAVLEYLRESCRADCEEVGLGQPKAHMRPSNP